MAVDSILESSAEKWHEILGLYDDVLQSVAKSKKKDKAKELITLDKWFQEDLPSAIRERSEKHVTKEELIKLMTWKLSRGKFRPRLVELIKSNSEETITSTTKKAFQMLPDVEKAIKTLSELRGVGPATASAALCAGSPKIPFMADEAMAALPVGRGKLQYTPKAYLQYVKELRSALSNVKKQDPKGNWNEHKVELTLWTYTTAKKYAPELLESPAKKQSRKRETEQSSEDEELYKKKKKD